MGHQESAGNVAMWFDVNGVHCTCNRPPSHLSKGNKADKNPQKGKITE